MEQLNPLDCENIFKLQMNAMTGGVSFFCCILFSSCKLCYICFVLPEQLDILSFPQPDKA